MSGSEIAYVLVHDERDYWLIDDLEVEDMLSETSVQLPIGFSRAVENVDIIDQGASIVKVWFNNYARTLRVILNWSGAI